MITSDGALNEYSAYRSGERFYVVIPEADAPRLLSSLRGRGFEDMRVQKRGNDVMISFRLLQGASARVSQKFNRLEILITVPALVAANNAATNNSNARPQPSPVNNASTVNANSRTPAGAGNNTNSSANPLNPTGDNTSQLTPQGTGTRRNPEMATTNPSFTNPPPGIPVGPDGTAAPTGTEGFPPLAGTSPAALPSITPPSDQIAQMQPTPGIPSTTGPPVTVNTSAPAPGTSLGAQLKQNWLFVVFGLAIVGLIAWVLIARSRADRSPVERRVETIRESKSEVIAAAKPAKAVVTPKAVATPKAVVVAPVVTPPAKAEAEPVVDEQSAPAPVVAAPVEDVSVEPVVAAVPVVAPVEEEVVTKDIEPLRPVAVEHASDEVRNLLAGHHYDEAVLGTNDAGARQMMTAELLAALAGRNAVRHERAREAFINHGYFDDATQTLRTAESPAERASAARSLGLVRDHSATPHLVAALEDSSPEVRRAAVESLAEVRDSSAVAPLEALRDREKDRRVPNALIQHAIEASVVGRAKAEPTAPVATPYATTPLTESVAHPTTPLTPETIEEPVAEEEAVQAVEAELPAAESLPEPVVEAAAPESVAPQITEEVPVAAEEIAVEEIAVEETAPPLPFSDEAVTDSQEVAEPVAFISPQEFVSPHEADTLEMEAVAAPPTIEEEVTTRVETQELPAAIEEPAAVEEAEPVQLAETEVVEEEAAAVAEAEAAAVEPPQAEAIAPVPEEVPAPVATAEPVIEYNDGTASEWVDVDMSAPEPASQTAPPPVTVTPDAPVEAASLTEVAPVVSAPPVMPVIAPVISETAAESTPAERGIEVAPERVERGIDVPEFGKEIEAVEEDSSSVPSVVLRRLASEDASERALAVADLGRIGGDDSFREISASFDDPSTEVRNAAARALFNLNPDRAASFTRALREAPPERRRHIGAALASSGLATEAIGHLMGESREKTYDAFSLLFLMSKAGEVQPLMRAVEDHPNNEVRLAVVKLLALSGQQEILPAFRRLAVRGSLPTEVRSAVMEAIYQISSQSPDTASRS